MVLLIFLGAALRILAYFAGIFTIGFALVSVYAARRHWFFRKNGKPETKDLPPVTILKPIKGKDTALLDCLTSFLEQDYPSFQVLFAVQNPEDPALPVLEQLKRQYPRRDIEIIVSKNRIGFNPKVNNLSNAYPYAKHEILVISDADIHAEPDFLRRSVALFEDPQVGMATCFYRSITAPGIGSLLESTGINAQFLPQALVAAFLLRLRFAMGAAMIVRKSVFDAVGGFQTLSDHLADDFVLGSAVRAAGYRLEFSTAMVDSHPGDPSFLDYAIHATRWARTIRACQPGGYTGLIVNQGFPLLTLSLLTVGRNPMTLALWLTVAATRILATAWTHFVYLDNPGVLGQLPLIPVSDLAQFFAWLSGFRSRAVRWRGEYYDIQIGGRLTPRKDNSGTYATVPQ